MCWSTCILCIPIYSYVSCSFMLFRPNQLILILMILPFRHFSLISVTFDVTDGTSVSEFSPQILHNPRLLRPWSINLWGLVLCWSDLSCPPITNLHELHLHGRFLSIPIHHKNDKRFSFHANHKRALWTHYNISWHLSDHLYPFTGINFRSSTSASLPKVCYVIVRRGVI